MPRPWKHPKTGVYWLRRRVPAHLRAVLGKAEEKRSLGTKDPAEAKRLFVAAMQEVEARWANLSNPAPALSEREADDIASPIYHWHLAMHRDNPSEQRQWKTKYGHLCFVERSAEELTEALRDLSHVSESEIWRIQMESWCAELAAELRTSKGLADTPTNNRRLARGVAKALQAASLELEALAAVKYTLVCRI